MKNTVFASDGNQVGEVLSSFENTVPTIAVPSPRVPLNVSRPW